jgi:hypothetical protein
VRYFLATNPLAALSYTGMGLTLLARGKIHPELPHLGGEGRMDRMFNRVAELEGKRPSPDVGRGEGGKG